MNTHSVLSFAFWLDLIYKKKNDMGEEELISTGAVLPSVSLYCFII